MICRIELEGTETHTPGTQLRELRRKIPKRQRRIYIGVDMLNEEGTYIPGVLPYLARPFEAPFSLRLRQFPEEPFSVPPGLRGGISCRWRRLEVGLLLPLQGRRCSTTTRSYRERSGSATTRRVPWKSARPRVVRAGASISASVESAVSSMLFSTHASRWPVEWRNRATSPPH